MKLRFQQFMFLTLFAVSFVNINIVSKVEASILSESDGDNIATGFIPDEWRVLPEEEALKGEKYFPNKTLSLSRDKSLPKLGRHYDHILSINETVVSGLKTEQHGMHLSNLRLDLGVSASGMLGIVAASGQPFVEMYWRRCGGGVPKNTNLAKNAMSEYFDESEYSDKSENSYRSEEERNLVPSENTLRINKDMSSSELDAQVEPVVKMAIASGKIRNSQQLRKNIRQVVKLFHSSVSTLDSPESEKYQWWPATFRLDFEIEASGTIVLIPVKVAVGGKMRFRVEWVRLQKNTMPKDNGMMVAAMNKISTNDHTSINPHLLSFVKSVSSALDTLPETATTSSSTTSSTSRTNSEKKEFKLDRISVGVGFSVTGKVFLAKLKAGATGYLYFKKGKVKSSAKYKDNTEHMSDELWIQADGDPATVKFAKGRDVLVEHDLVLSNGVPVDEKSLMKSGSSDKAIVRTYYKVPLDRFRSGLLRAESISRFFTNRSQGSCGRWELYDVRPGFKASLTGTLAVVDLTSSASIQFFYKR
ncbi:MAG: hypothetical protein HQK53_05945 [Oligoflexia bacterium]|nr:hypothetical protein [Oligoflexia bacterium]